MQRTTSEASQQNASVSARDRARMGPGRLPGAGGQAGRGPMVNGHAPSTFASRSGNDDKKMKMTIVIFIVHSALGTC